MFKYPFSNFEKANLDWIIRKIKKLEPAISIVQESAAIVKQVQDTIDDARQIATTAQNTVQTVTAQASEAVSTATEAKEIAQQAASGTIATGAVTWEKLSSDVQDNITNNAERSIEAQQTATTAQQTATTAQQTATTAQQTADIALQAATTSHAVIVEKTFSFSNVSGGIVGGVGATDEYTLPQNVNRLIGLIILNPDSEYYIPFCYVSGDLLKVRVYRAQNYSGPYSFKVRLTFYV